jgi:hypothetical protein
LDNLIPADIPLFHPVQRMAFKLDASARSRHAYPRNGAPQKYRLLA